MENNALTNQTNPITPVTDVVDGAVGVEETHWYVAIVNNNSERSVAERLKDRGMEGAYESYVPIQREKRVWKNGRKKEIDRVLLSL